MARPSSSFIKSKIIREKHFENGIRKYLGIVKLGSIVLWKRLLKCRRGPFLSSMIVLRKTFN